MKPWENMRAWLAQKANRAKIWWWLLLVANLALAVAGTFFPTLLAFFTIIFRAPNGSWSDFWVFGYTIWAFVILLLINLYLFFQRMMPPPLWLQRCLPAIRRIMRISLVVTLLWATIMPALILWLGQYHWVAYPTLWVSCLMVLPYALQLCRPGWLMNIAFNVLFFCVAILYIFFVFLIVISYNDFPDGPCFMKQGAETVPEGFPTECYDFIKSDLFFVACCVGVFVLVLGVLWLWRRLKTKLWAKSADRGGQIFPTDG